MSNKGIKPNIKIDSILKKKKKNERHTKQTKIEDYSIRRAIQVFSLRAVCFFFFSFLFFSFLIVTVVALLMIVALLQKPHEYPER